MAAVPVVTEPAAGPRELYGAERLRAALAAVADKALQRREGGGRPACRGRLGILPAGAQRQCVDGRRRRPFRGALRLPGTGPPFSGRLAPELNVSDGPAFKIRGTNLFWMKWGEKGYDWPVVPANFPWFFDRALMQRYLDQLVENRYNTIYFWTGHPFPYFLDLPRYPEARMLARGGTEAQHERLKWFTTKADARDLDGLSLLQYSRFAWRSPKRMSGKACMSTTAPTHRSS